MIVTTDIGNILYRDCEAFGIDIVPDGETLTGELKSERIVIHSKKQQPVTYWKKSFVEVNLCVPDLSENSANSIRLGELEREANKLFDDVVSTYDGTCYRYSIESIGTEADTTLKCHYVNVRILFEVLRACLKFPPKSFYSASFEFLFGLFSSFSSSHSPLCSSEKQENSLKNNSQKNAEQNLNRL